MWSQAARSRLLAWFTRTGRELPWRGTNEPYRILISEVMLQQTQVARVVPQYEAFLERFPDLTTLAEAAPAEVVRAWRGLGYNRRALRLHAAARAVVARHHGRMPTELEGLLALPGVGQYTARAVLAFALDAHAAPVDTNVARVLARAVAGSPLTRRDAQELADALLPREQAGRWGQALMELGARVCTARAPDCERCPIAVDCSWYSAGLPAPDPAAAGAHRSRPQPAFAGSDRYHRGRLVDALREGPVGAAELAGAARLELAPSRLEQLVCGLIADGLAEWHGDALRLPL